MKELDILKHADKTDEELFRMIFECYYSKLCVTACLYNPDRDEAEDIVQQVFIKMWEGRHFRSINASVRSYLRSAVINACLNNIEKKKTSQKFRGQLPGEEIADKVIDFFENEEEIQVFEKALSEIPGQSRKAIELVYFSGHPYQKAADAMNISINTIKSHLKNGLRKIKESPLINHYYAEKKSSK